MADLHENKLGEAKSTPLEDAAHAARFAPLNGKISANTKENIKKMLAGEQGANKAKMEASVKAQGSVSDETSELFAETSRDETRHARMLEGLLKRYF